VNLTDTPADIISINFKLLSGLLRLGTFQVLPVDQVKVASRVWNQTAIALEGNKSLQPWLTKIKPLLCWMNRIPAKTIGQSGLRGLQRLANGQPTAWC